MKAVCRLYFLLLALLAAGCPVLLRATGYKLAIVPAGGKVTLSWPVAATNYVLQSVVGLTTTNWLTVTNPAAVPSNNTNYVTYTNNSVTRFFRLYLNTNAASGYAGMALIPAGSFTMGDVADTNINGNAAPVSVTVSAFYMDTNVVSDTLWQSVYSWATSVGYGFVDSGDGKAANEPVQTVDWFDAVKWCNARSQQAGLTPVYYTDAAMTKVYTNDPYGETNNIRANWTANGYRLPTEAEWEKAARGGLSGQRFPWGNLISESQANYIGYPPSTIYGDGFYGYFYDSGPYYYNAVGYQGNQPYTTPVGTFAPNAYGLFDMAGNVLEWCWDWYGTPYAGGTDPRGPGSGSYRVLRGGDWDDDASVARCANRDSDSPTVVSFGIYGFRCARGH